MLRLYLSYAPADRPYLDELLKWLKPLEEKYYLRIYFPKMVAVPRPQHYKHLAPGQMLIFPKDWEESLNQLDQAHIYLFLMSYHALSIPFIDQEEVPRAVERFHKMSDKYVRIFPVQLAPSLWDKYSRLSGFKVLGDKKTLAETDPRESGFKLMVEQLTLAIEELRRNWIEEQYRIGEPIDDFTRPELPAPTGPAYQAVSGWIGAVMLMTLFYLVTSWYFSGCAPRMYYLYTPKELPYEPLPEPYWRENPVQTPVDVPLRPSGDTTGQSQRLPKE